jgi:hypothetical protein
MVKPSAAYYLWEIEIFRAVNIQVLIIWITIACSLLDSSDITKDYVQYLHIHNTVCGLYISPKHRRPLTRLYDVNTERNDMENSLFFTQAYFTNCSFSHKSLSTPILNGHMIATCLISRPKHARTK